MLRPVSLLTGLRTVADDFAAGASADLLGRRRRLLETRRTDGTQQLVLHDGCVRQLLGHQLHR